MTEPRTTTVATDRTLLDGRTAADARAAVAAIARALADPPPAWIPDRDAEPYRLARGAGLFQGRAGLALFYAHLARSGLEVPGVDAAALAERYLDEACDALARVPMPAGLIRGCAGVLWARREVHRMLDDGDPGALDLAAEYLGYPADKDGFDLWQGLVGHGVYALDGLPDPAAARLVVDLVERLEAAAVRDRDGARWFTLPATLMPRVRQKHPRPFLNLGAAHGQAGVVAFLARAHAAGLAGGRAGRLAADAARWLLARVAENGAGSFLPSRYEPGVAPVMGMETWCNGTPGAAAALLLAGRRCGERAWCDAATALARDAARRAHGPRPDASICHGAAGEALLWHTFRRETGDEVFAAAARAWYRRTLDARRPGDGVAGYVALGFDNLGQVVEIHDPGLLQGAAGVGLVLLHGLGLAPAGWCRFLLLPDGHLEQRTSKDEDA